MMRKISDRVYYLPHDDTGDRPVLGYVRGDRLSLMIDAGNGAKHVRLYNESLAAADLKRPDFVALTHWHWDHTYGLHAVDCPSIACTQTNAYLGEMMAWPWSDEAMADRLATGADNEFCDRTIREEYPDRSKIIIRQADIAFDNALTLNLGGITAELRRVENPHTADGVIVWLPEEKLVFLGDAAYEGHHHGREPLYKGMLATLMSTMNSIPFETCFTGHEAPVSREALFAEWRGELAQ